MRDLERFVAVLALLLPLACGHPSFDPPRSPPHDDHDEGPAHARDRESPFLCRAPDNPRRGVPCPTNGRPPDDQLSCDALGCHGGYDYSGNLAGRHLRGSEGPSCTTCHGKEWDDRGR